MTRPYKFKGKRCKGICIGAHKKGKKCEKIAIWNGYCEFHQGQSADTRQQKAERK